MILKKLKLFKTEQVSSDAITGALSSVIDEDQGKDIISLGMVSGVQVQDGAVLFVIEVDSARGPALEPLRLKAEQAVLALDGVSRVTAVLAAARKAPQVAANQTSIQLDGQTAGKLASQTSSSSSSSSGHPDPHGMNKNPPLTLPIKKIIAVASGKGGVGKSTVAVNLALALSKAGLRAGILDADIYGPSVPRLLKLPAVKPEMNSLEKLVPYEAHGVKVMSIGFMVEEDTPMIWRGPMVQTAIYQMLRDVDWIDEASGQTEYLDVLVVDMPPGTGDAQLTMAQKVPLSGAIIVSTPQDIALIDARKGIGMFEKVDVPVLGIIENMSMFICPNCNHEAHIFGHGGAKAEATKLGCGFLGEIPLDIDIRVTSDEGQPVIVSNPDGAPARIFADIASQIKAQLFPA